VIKLIITRLRHAWPQTRFIVRADSGFCRRRLPHWCERSGVDYIVGLARNARLHALVQVAEATRRVRVMLVSHHPLRELFAVAAARLAASLFRILCVRHSMATERSLHDSQEQERGGHARGAI
jgi:hypothetical protein